MLTVEDLIKMAEENATAPPENNTPPTNTQQQNTGQFADLLAKVDAAQAAIDDAISQLMQTTQANAQTGEEGGGEQEEVDKNNTVTTKGNGVTINVNIPSQTKVASDEAEELLAFMDVMEALGG